MKQCDQCQQAVAIWLCLICDEVTCAACRDLHEASHHDCNKGEEEPTE